MIVTWQHFNGVSSTNLPGLTFTWAGGAPSSAGAPAVPVVPGVAGIPVLTCGQAFVHNPCTQSC